MSVPRLESNLPSIPGRPALPGWLKLALLYVLAHVAWELLAMARTPLVQLYDRSFLALFDGLVAWRFWRAAQRSQLSTPVCRGLKFIAAGNAAGALATVYLLTERYLRPAAPSIFSAADALFLATYPLILFGLFQLPRAQRTGAGPARILIDGVVFLVGIGTPLWLFVIAPDLHRVSGMDAVLVVAWPCAAFCGILAVNAALLTRAPVPSRGALWLLLTGVGLSWFSDLIFTLDAATGLVRGSSVNWINLSNAVSIGTCLYAAWRYESDPVVAGESGGATPFSPVPMITLLVVSGWLAMGAALHPGSIELDRTLPSLIVLFAMLFLRETLVMRDSLRWAAAEAQREGQVRFEALVRNSSDIIMIISPAGRLQFVSPAATAALGVPPEALMQLSLAELVHAEDEPASRDFFGRLLAAPGAKAFVSLRLRHGDGTYRHFEAIGANLLPEPSVAGLVLNLRNISERVELEERLHHAEKMEAVGRLAGGIAHDFNNLLAVILAGAELAAFDLPPEHPARREFDAIRQAGKRGATLTARLLAFGRRESPAPAVIAPGETIAALLPMLQSMVGAGLALQTRIDPAAGLVRVNPDGLEQALLNLTANARDASPGGGAVTIAVENAVLAAPLATPYLSAPPGRYVVIRVTDTGSGMDEPTRARLFEPFFTTKARGKGTGLGLASLYGMARTAGGGITVDSHPGRGTQISLWLPEVMAAVTPKTVSAAPFASAGGSETILLVEDEELVRLAAQRILEIKGYVVLTAANADEAHRVLQNHAGPLHLLLTDVIMPGQSGPVLAADLVRQRPDLRVMFMSGYTGRELATQGMEGAKSRLLLKPFTSEEMIAGVRAALTGPPGLG